MIERPYQNLRQWAAYFESVSFPVLSESIDKLAQLREIEDAVSAKDITRVVLRDPLLTLRVLRFIEDRARRRNAAEITTIEHAVMMLGVSPFFRTFDNLPSLDIVLAEHPEAIEGINRVVARARLASTFARDWAIVRHDTDTEEVVLAALLHELPELLLWTFAAPLASDLEARVLADPTQKESNIQLQALGVRLNQLQLELAHRWRLPELLIRLMDDAHADHPRVRNVVLAVALARNITKAGPQSERAVIIDALGALLHLSQREVVARVAPFIQEEPAAAQDELAA